MEVGLDARPKASTQLGVPTCVGGCHLRLGVAAVRPQPHPGLPDPEGAHPRGFIQGNGAHRVHSTVGSIGGRPIAEPVHPRCHNIAEAPRVVSMAEELILQHLHINATWAGAAGEACRRLCDALLKILHRHQVQAIGGSDVSIKVLL